MGWAAVLEGQIQVLDLADGLGVGRGSQNAGGFLGIARMDFDHTGDRGKPAGL
jgi:hypothetical protein